MNDNLKDFVKFLTKKDGLFDIIGFNIASFCGKGFYAWMFPDCKKYIDSCLNDNCRCDINSDLLEIVHNIHTRYDLDCAQKTIAFKLMGAYSKKYSHVPTYSLVHFVVRVWGNIKAKDKLLSLYSESLALMRISRGVCAFFNNIDKNNIYKIASWSKILSTCDPVNYFVYDARISMALRLMWGSFNNYRLKMYNNKVVETPFVFVRGRNEFINNCLSRFGCLGSVNQNLQFIESYKYYCCLIKAIAERLLASGRFGVNTLYINNIINAIEIEDDSIDAVFLEKAILYQMTEMAIFALIGNAYSSRKNLEYYYKSNACSTKCSECCYDLSKMPQLVKLIEEAVI